MTSDIEIIRDTYGVPHCFASSEHDAFFAQGFVHAADRMWQMEYDRRRASGRWAEVAGRRGLALDVFYRRMDLVTAVQRDLAALAPDTRSMLDAYTAGVNAWLDRDERTREFDLAGVEPERWEAWHCLAVYRVRHLMMGSARSKLWRAVVADALGDDVSRTMVAGWGEDHIACVPPGAPCAPASGLGDVDGGSNNWVLAGERTASGKPLLAGDPHRELEAPNVYVQGHLACPSWDVLGIGMPGVPGFPHFGHNDRVAWSITHAMADDQDLFLFDGDAFEPARRETIAVRDEAPVDVDVTITPRGPIVGEGLALCWTATIETNTGFDAIVPMVRARTVDELFDTMRPWVEPANNLLAADVDGSIGYLTRGRLPKRARPDAVWTPVPGSDERYSWQGWVAFEDLPRCVNPDGGFLFSANNAISADVEAPYVGLDAAPPWRARRIVATLEQLKAATVADMEALHRDALSMPAARWLARLGSWPAVDGWDGVLARSSVPAAAYSRFRRELFQLVLERSGLDSVLDDPRNRLLPGVVPESVAWRVVDHHANAGATSLLGNATWDELISTAMARVDAASDGTRWGALHTTGQRHALADATLDPPPVEMGGDLDTVMAASYIPTQGFTMRAGAVARYAFDVADWDASGWVVPLGAAGDVAHAHGLDQQPAWAEGRLVPALYSRDAVDAAATSRDTLRSPA